MIVAGLMSGTSLDGLDICVVDFPKYGNIKILETKTFPYTDEWKSKLSQKEISGFDLCALNNEFAELCVGFLSSLDTYQKGVIELISSHGHTIYHNINQQVTYQVGSGAVISALTMLPVVTDFRSMDVALGGQGAPLVPFGESILFPKIDAFLNLGGIANISIHNQQKLIGYDISPFNIFLNHFSQKLGFEYDKDGKLSRKGILHPELLASLNEWNYLIRTFPKSLDKEITFAELLPVLNQYLMNPQGYLATLIEWYADLISKSILKFNIKEIMITGGGTYNNTFLQKLEEKSLGLKMIIPEKEMIDFKEAYIFAFLGLRRFNLATNVDSSVTGSKRDQSGGALYIY